MKKLVMIIMDGYGIAPATKGNAIAAADTPVLDMLFDTCPNTAISASGEDVGLPAGQIGNSEVGHTNIGAGRVVYQDLPRITKDIKTGDFFSNETLLTAIRSCKAKGKALHLLGLLSPGGVHSHLEHLFGLLEFTRREALNKVYIHCFMDGRDVPPDSGIDSVKETVSKCAELGVGKIATITGRFYAMDRDNRWQRVEEAYNALVFGKGISEPDPVKAVQNSYDESVFDEFIKPVICDSDGMIKEDDTIIFFNFRPDRAREITRAFIEPGFDGFERKNGYFPLTYCTMTQYDEKFTGVSVAYPPSFPEKTLGEIISAHGMTQLRIAETEKYAHVTFFLNGGAENPFEGEQRILVPSPKEFPTYDLIPQMSALKVAEKARDEIVSGKFDVVIINFANCDMVGHTGFFDAAREAVQTVDKCVGIIKEAADKIGAFLLVTADHGNAEVMLAEDGIHPHTAHSVNPVPFIIYGADKPLKLRPDGRLSNIAPTILDLIGIEKPQEMTETSLIN